MNLKRCSRFAPIFILAGSLSLLQASEMAQATFTATQLNPSTWQYDVSLVDTGTTNIGTFWFAWVPGEDFLPTSPTNVLSPASWTDQITHGGASDGFAIQWVAGPGAAVTPGSTLQGFQFDSTTSPTAILGNSPFFPTTPILTTFVYAGAPLSDPGFQLQVQAAAVSTVPEPASAMLSTVGVLGLLCFVVRRRFATRQNT
jgi:hypothetical protein